LIRTIKINKGKNNIRRLRGEALLAKTRRVLRRSDTKHKKVATEVATLDGHPLTAQRMPSLANAKFKKFFEY
jgi:hypothetical protein